MQEVKKKKEVQVDDLTTVDFSSFDRGANYPALITTIVPISPGSSQDSYHLAPYSGTSLYPP